MTRTIRIVFAAIVCATAAAVLSAQAPAPSTYQPSKTPWGDPDLQGIWPSTDMVGVPFERPKQFGTRLFLTDAEFKARQDQAAKQSALDVLEFDLEKPPADVVAFRNEMIHETRIIPLDDRPLPPSMFKGYMGYSRGHFEGNTLVVRTTNLNGKTGAQGNGSMLLNSDTAMITERFTPVSKDVLQ